MAAVQPASGAQSQASLLDKVTIVTVTYNSAHCMRDWAQGLQVCPHVIVVDNASHDDTVKVVQDLLPQVQMITLAENKGFGVANNMALERLQTPYALLLNPDCLIDAKRIAALVMAAEEDWPNAALIAPQILDSKSNPQLNYSWPRHTWKAKTPKAEGPMSVGYACAAAWLLNMKHMQSTGFFDPNIFLYYEDEDLCLRLFEQKKDIIILPRLHVKHSSRGSVKGKHPYRAEYLRGFHHMRSKLYFEHKHFKRPPNKLKRFLASLAMVAVRLVFFSPKHLSRALGRLRGVLAGMKTPKEQDGTGAQWDTKSVP